MIQDVPAIDPKSPYGNSGFYSVGENIAKILNLKMSGVEKEAEELYERLHTLPREREREARALNQPK